jgi:hypothetical protein
MPYVFVLGHCRSVEIEASVSAFVDRPIGWRAMFGPDGWIEVFPPNDQQSEAATQN